MNDLRYEVMHDLYTKETYITVDDWFETWMNEYKKNSAKYGTFTGYQRTYRLYIKEKLGKRKLTAIRPEHIQNIYNGLRADDYSDKTISLVSIVLGGMFKQAYKNQMIQRNPVSCASIPKRTAQNRPAVTVRFRCLMNAEKPSI